MTAQGTETVLSRDATGCLDEHQNQTRFCCQLDDEAAYALGTLWSGRQCAAKRPRHLPTSSTVRLPQATKTQLPSAHCAPPSPDLGICCSRRNRAVDDNLIIDILQRPAIFFPIHAGDSPLPLGLSAFSGAISTPAPLNRTVSASAGCGLARRNFRCWSRRSPVGHVAPPSTAEMAV